MSNIDNELDELDSVEVPISLLCSKDIQRSRYTECKSCDNFQNTIKICKKCGCFMPAKVKLTMSECPIKKW